MATKIKTAQNNIHTTITELFKEWNPDWKGNNKVKLTKRSDRKIKGDITLTSESMVVTGKALIKET